MRQTKLIETIRTLDTRERTRWRQYVCSDFFNKHTVLRKLCDYILSQAPDFAEKNLDKRMVFSCLFGTDAPYDEWKLNNLVSDLYALLLGFLAHVRWQNDPLEQQYQRIGALLDRSLDKQAAAELDKYRVLLDRTSDRSAEWYRHEARLWETGEILQSRQSRRSAGEHLYRQAEAVYHLHLMERLRLRVALASRKSLSTSENGDNSSHISVLYKFDSYDNPAALPPAARIYLAAKTLIEEPSRETFENLTALLEAHYRIVRKEELSALYQCALNYCIRRINDGQADAYADALALYRILLERGLLLHGGRLLQWTYKNIATAGLRSGAFDWTEQFLHTYKHLLFPSERDNAFTFNLATLHFEKQEFSKALRALQNVEFTDITYHVGAKILQLKSFFLLNETEALYSLIEATEQLLRRSKSLSAFGKTTNLHFLRMLRQVSHWKHKQMLWPAEKAQRERVILIEKIGRLQPLANRDWLLKVLSD